MAEYLIASTIILPDLPVKINYSNSTFYSPRSSIYEEYATPRSSIACDNASSDSSSTLTGHSSNEDTDCGDYLNVKIEKRVRFSVSTTSTIETQVIIQNDEAEFFAVAPNEDINNNNINDQQIKTVQPRRKRDRISSLFHRKYSQSSNSDTSDNDTREWGEMLAKSVITMHQDIHEIITGIDEIDQPLTDHSVSNVLEKTITNPHLSYRDRQRAKLEMIRMAQILHPPNLLTYDVKSSPYPYTDIVAPRNFNSLQHKTQMPLEYHLVQHRPIRHEKLRYRTQRGLLKVRRDLKQLKRTIYGKGSSKICRQLQSFDVQNYRNRLEKTLREVRTQIAEYDRIHASVKDHRQSISQIIAKMKAMDPSIKAQIDDYRTKLRPIEYIEDKQNELISTPFIPHRARITHSGNTKTDSLIDTRFDPTTFIDLNKEAEEFFGDDIPFWDDPSHSISALSSPPERRKSVQFTLPEKPGIFNRLVRSFKSKQKQLRITESNETDNEFVDCNSPLNSLSQQQQPQIESVEF